MATEQPRSSAVELLETKPDPVDTDTDVEKPKPTIGENEKESVISKLPFPISLLPNTQQTQFKNNRTAEEKRPPPEKTPRKQNHFG